MPISAVLSPYWLLHRTFFLVLCIVRFDTWLLINEYYILTYSWTAEHGRRAFSVTGPTLNRIKSNLLKQKDQWRIQGGGGVAAPAIGSEVFFQKAAFFRVKGIQFVVCICDK